MKRAALYVRVSTLHQDLDLQVSDLRRMVEQRGWVTARIFEDKGVSGSTTERLGLDEMMDCASRGEIDVVVVWKLDRLGRSLVHLLQLLNTLSEQGVAFVSHRDSMIDTSTSGGRLQLALIGAFAEFERDLIQERVRAGMAAAKRRGVHCGRPRVSYDLRPARAMLAGGYSLRATADALNISRATLARRLKEDEADLPIHKQPTQP